MGENWETSAQSKEKVKANLQYKQEAAMRRERAMAYAYSQQVLESHFLSYSFIGNVVLIFSLHLSLNHFIFSTLGDSICPMF